jgi:predicted DNA-binding mobile mystery protein A
VEGFRELRVRQLSRALSAFDAAKKEPRPQRGWLRTIREALGMSLSDLGRMLNRSKQVIQLTEQAEANDRITLRTLRRVAAAMQCELVYALVPKTGTITELAESRERAQATEDVLRVENTMALENQATGNGADLIEDEMKRRQRK